MLRHCRGHVGQLQASVVFQSFRSFFRKTIHPSKTMQWWKLANKERDLRKTPVTGDKSVLSIPAVMVSKGVIVDLNHVPWLPGSHTKKQEDFHRIFVKNILWDGTKTDPAKQWVARLPRLQVSNVSLFLKQIKWSRGATANCREFSVFLDPNDDDPGLILFINFQLWMMSRFRPTSDATQLLYLSNLDQEDLKSHD